MKKQIVKKIIQKELKIVMTFILLFNFIMPNYSYSKDISDYVVSSFAALFTILGDTINNIIYVSIGKTSPEIINLIPIGDGRSYIEGNESIGKFLEKNGEEYDESKGININVYTGELTGNYGVPNIKISPAEIFSNKVSMLNANLFDMDQTDEIGGEERSIIAATRKTIVSWYNSLRQIAIVGLLSVLVYIGLRILLAATAQDKAKYKEMLQDWVVSMCLVFGLHYIMSFTMTAVDEIVKVVNSDSNEKIDQNTDSTTEKQVHITAYQGTRENPVFDDSIQVNELLTSKMNLGFIKKYLRVLSENEDTSKYSFENNKTAFYEMYKESPGLFKEKNENAFNFISETETDENGTVVYNDNREVTIKSIFWMISECKNDYRQGIILYRAALYSELTDYQKLRVYELWSYDYSVDTSDSGEIFRNMYDSVADGPKNPTDGSIVGKIDTKDSKEVKFYTNLVGYMRLIVENKNYASKVGAAIMYLGLSFYTVYFVFIYLKRVLMLTFLTLIAPLVALTYPIDKIRDSNAQAFNFWLKEYLANATLPIIHSILYTVLVTSAIELAAAQPIYAICALAFIVPAEKYIKDMFGIRGDTAPKLGGFAGGAMAANMLNKVANGIKKKSPEPNKKIRTNPQGEKATARDYVEGVESKGGAEDGNENGNGNNQTIRQSPQNDDSSNQTDTQQNTETRQNVKQHSSEQPIDKGKKKRLKNIGGNVANMLIRKFKLTKGKIPRQLMGRVGKLALRGTTRAAFMGIGLAGGIVGGNMSDMWKGLAGGYVAGGIAGDKFTKKVANLPKKVGDFAYELKNGEDATLNKQALREFKNDDETFDYIRRNYKGESKERKQQIIERMYNLKNAGAGEDLDTLDELVKIQEEEMSQRNASEELATKRAIYVGKLAKDMPSGDILSGDKEKYVAEQKRKFSEYINDPAIAEKEARRAVENAMRVNGNLL